VLICGWTGVDRGKEIGTVRFSGVYEIIDLQSPIIIKIIVTLH
jgi:hypothetical protein